VTTEVLGMAYYPYIRKKYEISLVSHDLTTLQRYKEIVYMQEKIYLCYKYFKNAGCTSKYV
jgi:hypothetical protein